MPILILSFYLARLYIGGVVALESEGDVEPEREPGPEAVPTYLGPTACSSFYNKLGVDLKSVERSSFIIELVGMFGVSFSKPPCINITVSIAQTVCLNLYKD